jgi:uncharacterized protein (TIGR00251 family)
LREHDGEVWLSLKVQPRASRNELAGLIGNELKLKVTAPPVDSAANEAVLAFLTEVLGRPRRDVTLQRGRTSPHKTVAIRGLTLAEAAARLDL